MGVEPTQSHRRGDTIVSAAGKHSRTCRLGVWSLSLEPGAEPRAELEAAIVSLLSRLPSDLSVWSRLSAKYEIDLFCGLFLEAPNRGLTLSPDLLKRLGERGIELGLDIYSPNFDEALASFLNGPPGRRDRSAE